MQNGWEEWCKHVLTELHRLNESQEGIKQEVKGINIEIAKLKVKSGFWGVIGGVASVLLVIAIWIIQEAIKTMK